MVLTKLIYILYTVETYFNYISYIKQIGLTPSQFNQNESFYIKFCSKVIQINPRQLHIHFYGTKYEIWADFEQLTILKKKIWADYEQLLREVFSTFFCP